MSQPPGEVIRPKTSTRDREEVRQRLGRWLARRLPAAGDLRIPALDIPASNGMSSETWLFDATWSEVGGTRRESFVARVAPDPSAVPVFRVYDMERQARVMRIVREESPVPVPRVFWSEPDGEPLGASFLVMERIDGQVPPDVMPYNFGSWLSEAPRDAQARLQESTVRILALLYAIEAPERKFAFLHLDRPEPTPLRRHFGDQRSYYAWVSAGLRSPLIERTFAWLEEHWPSDEGPTVLSWGDARIGNVMYRDFEPVAVLDWEMAALAPPEVDLGWLIHMHRFFEDVAAGHGLPGMPHFLRRADVAATFAELTGYAPRALEFYEIYAALRYAIIMFRILRRAIHFGEAAMPDDVDDMLMNRPLLERMLADAGSGSPPGP